MGMAGDAEEEEKNTFSILYTITFGILPIVSFDSVINSSILNFIIPTGKMFTCVSSNKLTVIIKFLFSVQITCEYGSFSP